MKNPKIRSTSSKQQEQQGPVWGTSNLAGTYSQCKRLETEAGAAKHVVDASMRRWGRRELLKVVE